MKKDNERYAFAVKDPLAAILFFKEFLEEPESYSDLTPEMRSQILRMTGKDHRGWMFLDADFGLSESDRSLIIEGIIDSRKVLPALRQVIHPCGFTDNEITRMLRHVNADEAELIMIYEKKGREVSTELEALLQDLSLDSQEVDRILGTRAVRDKEEVLYGLIVGKRANWDLHPDQIEIHARSLVRLHGLQFGTDLKGFHLDILQDIWERGKEKGGELQGGKRSKIAENEGAPETVLAQLKAALSREQNGKQFRNLFIDQMAFEIKGENRSQLIRAIEKAGDVDLAASIIRHPGAKDFSEAHLDRLLRVMSRDFEAMSSFFRSNIHRMERCPLKRELWNRLADSLCEVIKNSYSEVSVDRESYE